MRYYLFAFLVAMQLTNCGSNKKSSGGGGATTTPTPTPTVYIPDPTPTPLVPIYTPYPYPTLTPIPSAATGCLIQYVGGQMCVDCSPLLGIPPGTIPSLRYCI